MPRTTWVVCAAALACLASYESGRSTKARPADAAEPAVAVDAAPANEFTGKTQPAPGKSAQVCPVPLHPVEEVFVKVGDRVKKEDKLVRLDDDEPKADVRAKQAALDAASINIHFAKDLVERLQPLQGKGAIPEQRLHEAKLALAKAEADERAAQANLESAKAELEHYLVTAPMDGIISSLNVVPGMVSRPGTTVWGQILDLSTIDVRCDVTPAQADRLAIGQTAEVTLPGTDVKLTGQVAVIGIAADPQTGKVPVLIRVDNRNGKLRCYVDTKVRFTGGAASARK